MTSQAIVGRVGVVVVRIRGGEQSGEVRVVVQGMPHYYLAFSAGVVETGLHIVVINNRGAGRVDVEPIPLADPSFDLSPVERT